MKGFANVRVGAMLLALIVGCSESNHKVHEVSIVIPERGALLSLDEEAAKTLRATLEVTGFLAPSPLIINPTTGELSGSFILPDEALGTQEATILIYAARSSNDTEVLLFRSRASFELKPNQNTDIIFSTWEGNTFDAEEAPPLEFDANRNGRSNWADLLNPLCNPAQEDSPIDLSPRTVGFESGVEQGRFTRSFVVVHNRGTESVHFQLGAKFAPGVTVAELDELLEQGSRASSASYDSTGLDTEGNPRPLGPNEQRVFAVTFSPTSKDFLSGALSLDVRTLDCNNRYGELVRVLGNPDGSVPTGPENYDVALFPADQNLDLFSGEVEALDTSTLFSSAPELARVEERDVGSIYDQDIDAAYIVAVPEGYQFSLIFDGLASDVDLFLYLLDQDFNVSGREPIDESKNTGLAPESVSFGGSSDGDVYLVLGIDRVTDPSSPNDIAKADSDDANPTMYAGLVIFPEFKEACTVEDGEECSEPLEGSGQCPETYNASFACGPAGAPGNLVLRGNHFLPGAQVSVDGVEATCSSVEELELFDEIRCTVPTIDDVSDEGKTVSISLRNPDGQFATFVDGFTYLPPNPTLSSITPSEGPITGGTPVSIRGTGIGGELGVVPQVIFSAGSETQFLATEVVWISKQQLTAVVPECLGCEPGLFTVSLINPDGQPSSANVDFNYTQPAAAPPSIDDLDPSNGPRRGGTLVTLSGSGFEPGISVRVGGTSATNVQVSGEGTLTFKTPPGEVGEAQVTVVNPDGQTATWGSTFAYDQPSPQLSNVSPAFGPIIGGYQVSLWGADFEPGTTVFFNNRSATQVAVVSSSLLTALVPAGDIAGLVEVRIEDVYGTTVSLPTGFEYTSLVGDPPVVTQIVPSEGSVRGGENATVSGANFETDVEVFFGGVSATSVTKLSDEALLVVTPANPAGLVDVVVRNPDGREAGGASYGFIPLIPVLDNILPNAGSAAGGTVMTLSGENFDPAAQVFVGDKPCLNMTFINTRSLSCRTPQNTSGTVSVRVVNPDGTATDGISFTYEETQLPPPVVATVNPPSGLPSGGYVSLLSGEFFTPDALVYFGETLAEVTERIEDTTIRVIVPSGEPSSIATVLVQNSDGQVGSATFFYEAAPTPEPGAPLVESISPDFGPLDGGTLVQVYGQELSEDTEIFVGGALCLNATVIGSRLMTCETPAGQAGNVDVLIQNARGSDRLNGGFKYEAPADPAPSIVSMSPGQGRPGDAIVIRGGPFVIDDGFRVTFGSAQATLLSSRDEDGDGVTDELSLVVPSGPDSAAVTVRVQNPDGQTATVTFQYLAAEQDVLPTIESVAPAALACNQPTDFWVLGEYFGAIAESAGELRFSDDSWMPIGSAEVFRVSDIAARVSLSSAPGDFGPCESTEGWSELAELTLNFVAEDGSVSSSTIQVTLVWEEP